MEIKDILLPIIKIVMIITIMIMNMQNNLYTIQFSLPSDDQFTT